MVDLQTVSREGAADFHLPLENAPDLYCQEIVRRLPGRRLVCRGLWHGQAVFAKLFIGNGAHRYADRDARGARALTENGLLAPALLHDGNLSQQSGRALIYALVAESENAEAVWQRADAAQRKLLAAALIETIARHHAAGLVQTDLYLRNFLCTDAGLYTLDGDGIRIHSRPINEQESTNNLALLLSKFDVLDDGYIPEWLRIYREARKWNAETIHVKDLGKKVQAIRRKVALDYARKVMRNCTDVRVEQSFKRFMAVNRAQQSGELRQVIGDPDAWLNAPECLRLKNGNTCTVGLAQAGARKIVIKRYNIKNLRHGLSRALRRTRASTSWRNAHLLDIYDIPTPTPLALVEKRWGVVRGRSYFLAAFVGGPDIAEVYADASLPEARKKQVAEKVANLLRKLYLLKIEHGDLKASNLKLVDDEPLVLDLDAMKQHRCAWWFRKKHARDLRRFLKNWQNAPDILRTLQSALITAYGNDPVLAMAGVVPDVTSENK
jgi:tRNA A-37 threonylcarbamoyl transferase component Bud32